MKSCLLSLLVAASLLVGCSHKEAPAPPVATATVTLANARVPLGSPVDVKYRFVVAPDARIDGDYRVFVHFLEAGSREMMWADDHEPPVPTSSWKPGQTIEYTRTVFAPVYPYVGKAVVEAGLYSKSKRLMLAGGVDNGHRSFELATLELLPQTENVFLIYKDGWYPTEVTGDSSATEWQWTKKDAVIAFRNPKRDIVFFLQLDRLLDAVPAPTVTVRLGDQVVDTFPVGKEELRRVAIGASQLGTGEMAELKISVDRTFVPSLLPAANSGDVRELGVRVFHAFVAAR